VREPSYSDSLARFRFQAQKRFPDAVVEPCFWGGTCGARLKAGGASVPRYDITRAIDEDADTEARLIALWELLYRDPLFECRLLKLGKETPMFPVRQQPALIRRLTAGLTATAAAPVAKASGEAGANELLDAACIWLAAEPEFKDLAWSATDETDFADAAARTVVAKACQLAEERDVPFPATTDALWRDAVVDALTAYLAGNPRGFTGALFDTVTAPLQRLALVGASWQGARNRGKLTDSTLPAGGDILLYQARGKPFRDFIRERIHASRANVLVAHSLGGVACVDMLIEAAEPGIGLLVTAGTQAAYFHEIDALQSMRFEATAKPEARLPATFPKWINFYDLRDFLSFIGGGVFGSRVVDVRVKNGQPFPQSHGAYWSNPAFWDGLVSALSPQG
jgi:hypothetical protein